MITYLPTGMIRRGLPCAGAAAAMLLLAGIAQALTFISPMGEPFRTTSGDAPEDLWFARADADHDGKITRTEFTIDAGRFFRLVDTNHDNRIGPEEIQHYEDDVAPETLGGGDGSRRHDTVSRATQTAADEDNITSTYLVPPERYHASDLGAARFSYLDLPEPVAAADINFDRTISPREFVDAARQRFDALDADHDGSLTKDEFPHLSGGRDERGAQRRSEGPRSRDGRKGDRWRRPR